MEFFLLLLLFLTGMFNDLINANPLGKTSLILLVLIFVLRVGAKNIIIFTEKKLKNN